MATLDLKVLFNGIDKLSGPMKAIIGGSNNLSKAFKQTAKELKDLEEQQRKIARFTELQAGLKKINDSLDKHKQTIKNLKNEAKLGPLTQEQVKALNAAESAVKRLNREYKAHSTELTQVTQDIQRNGMSINRLSDHENELKNRIHLTTMELNRRREALERNTLAHQRYDRTQASLRKGAELARGGLVAAGVGAAAIYQLRRPVNESKNAEIEEARIASLGLGKEATKEAIEYAKAMRTFGTSTLDNLKLVRDGVTAFADVHHAQMVAPTLAKMKFSNEAMYGNEQGAENEKKFMDMLKVIEMRNGLKSEKAFQEQANIIQQVITATGGRVQAEEWLNVIKTGGIAAKGMDNKAFYYKMEPLVQEMGGHRVGTSMMSAYQNLYQGRTTQRAAANLDKFGLIGDYSKVKHNKTGDLSYLDIGAIKGADLFKKDQFAWMEKILVPALNAKGITKEGDVIDAIGSIFSNRTASNLFAQMYMQREQIHKNSKLNEGADNIDQLDSKARNTTGGKELEAKAKLHNAYLSLGQTVLPIYTQVITMATNAIQVFDRWIQRNPVLAATLTKVLIGATVLIGVVSALALGVLSILGPLALMRLTLTTLGGGASVASTAFKMLVSPIRMVGAAFMWVGRAMLANPMILAITAIVAVVAGAAYLIYKNWTPIKGFFSNLWESVKSAFNTGVSFIKGIIQSVDAVFANNPILNLLLPIVGIPRLIIANWSSISAFVGGVWQSIGGAVSTGVSAVFGFVSSGFNSILSTASMIWGSIKGVVSSAWTGLCNLIMTYTPLGFVMGHFNSILAFLSNIATKMMSIGKNIIDGLIDGIKSGFERLKSIWNTVNSYLPDFMRKRMDIHSPSRVMRGLGGYIVDGIGVGISSKTPNLKNQFDKTLGVFDTGAPASNFDSSSKFSTPSFTNVQPIKSRNLSYQSNDQITIHVSAPANSPVHQAAKQVRQELEERDRKKQEIMRRWLKDQE